MKKLRMHKKVILKMIDIIVIIMSYCLAEILLAETLNFNKILLRQTVITVVSAIIIYVGMLEIFKTYKNITRYENGTDYLVYILACLVAYITISVLKIFFRSDILAQKINIIAAILIIMLIISYRVILRMLLNEGYKLIKTSEKGDTRKRVLIIGAGEATKIVLGTLKTTFIDTYKVIGLIDDNVNKVNYAISGYSILGTREDIPKICEENKIDLILFSISNIRNEQRKQILQICQSTGCKVRILPGTQDLIKNKNIMENFRDVEIEDLLGRETVKLNNKDIKELIREKVVLVTGGGGSIGSELCRQIAYYNPSKLVIVDIYENNLYDIEQELKYEYPKLKIEAIVASVRDKKRMDEIFGEFKPYLVFHAAAHKHVPLMETSPLEAIKNNVFGTYNVVNCADEFNVKRFILISTDKAVNPTNIMGATKRLCEMIVQAKDKTSNTEYAAVRFGNVLGSNGSVIPLFKKQIANGGPVTVTHKEITRFFMTIPEAVSLVLQAMSYAKGGEIFVLDMGEPVKIYDMAQNLIRLSGLEPGVDIQIKITGLRPGEKLYEEILMNEENLKQTKHEKIYIAPPSNIEVKQVEAKLRRLNKVLKENNNEQKEEIKAVIKEVVPTYKENNNQ